jgi:hypothetical protein
MRKLTTVFVVLLCLAAMAGAQTITGTITGTVTDASGAVSPNVKITATNEGTGVQTDGCVERGRYLQPSISSCRLIYGVG